MNKTIIFLKFALMFFSICAIILGLLEHDVFDVLLGAIMIFVYQIGPKE